MSRYKTPVTTRAQREAIYRLFARHYEALDCEVCPPGHLFPNRFWFGFYRQYRKRFQLNGIGSDLYLFGQPYQTGERGMWVGIETDGYTHS